jgi:hypothetical protein
MDEAGGMAEGEMALRGWALRAMLERRGEPTDDISSRLGEGSPAYLPQMIAVATREWNHLIAELDRAEENLEHVRRETVDVFFRVLETLIAAEGLGDAAARKGAAALFNAVVREIYVFEPMADVAAELERPLGEGGTRLSDLFCTGVSRLFDGQVAVRTAREQRPVAEFVGAGEVLRGAGVLTPAKLGERLAGWWYVKWAAQRLKLAVAGRELRVSVWEEERSSTGLDGWEVRFGGAKGFLSGTIRAGAAVLKLPERVDAGGATVQVREAGGEWAEVFARVGV